MGRRRLPALLALLAGLLLGVGAGAQGVAASGPTAAGATHARLRSAHVDSAHGESGRVGSGADAFTRSAPRPAANAVVRAGHGGHGGGPLREIAVLVALSPLAVALLAYLVRQRRRSRPPGWHRSTLLARGPPLLLAR